MLRSYGRLTSSLSFAPCTIPLRNARRAYSAIKGDGDDAPTSQTEAPPKPKRMKRYLGMIEATGLAEIQAQLEESQYRGKRQPRKEIEDSGTKKPRTGEKSAAKDDPRPPLKKARQSKTKTAQDDEELKPGSFKNLGRQRQVKVAGEIPARLLPTTKQKHHNLATFLNHIKTTKGSTTSTVYKGTHFEYTVAEALKSYNFSLHRTGRSNDLGIDLVGRWGLPAHTKDEDGMPVLLQCKFAKPTPAMVRELEGAYTGAPAGWQGDGVLALLVSTQASTEGVRAACQRSRWPLGVVQITREGEVKQFIWNSVAADAGLEGLGVGVRYDTGGPLSRNSGAAVVGQSIVLTWMGKPWKPPGVKKDVIAPVPEMAADPEAEEEFDKKAA